MLEKKSAEEDRIAFKSCQKFSMFGHSQSQSKDAIVYLKLRYSGCPRKEAILFTNKGICRSDSTKQIDGPRNFRMLERQSIDNFKLKKGWYYDRPNYDMGKNWIQNTEDILKEDSDDEKLAEDLRKHEKERQSKMTSDNLNMHKYLKQLSEAYNFKQKDLKDRSNAIKVQVHKTSNELKTRKYFEIGDVRFLELAEQLYQRRLDENFNNILCQQNPFEDLLLTEKVGESMIYNELDNRQINYADFDSSDIFSFNKLIRKKSSMDPYDTVKEEEKEIDVSRIELLQKETNKSRLFKHLNSDDYSLLQTPTSKQGNTSPSKQLQFDLLNMDVKGSQDDIKQFNEQKYLFGKGLPIHSKIQNKEILKKLNKEQYKKLVNKFYDDENNFNSVYSSAKEKEWVDLESQLQDHRMARKNNQQIQTKKGYYQNLDKLCEKSEKNLQKFLNKNVENPQHQQEQQSTRNSFFQSEKKKSIENNNNKQNTISILKIKRANSNSRNNSQMKEIDNKSGTTTQRNFFSSRNSKSNSFYNADNINTQNKSPQETGFHSRSVTKTFQQKELNDINNNNKIAFPHNFMSPSGNITPQKSCRSLNVQSYQNSINNSNIKATFSKTVNFQDLKNNFSSSKIKSVKFNILKEKQRQLEEKQGIEQLNNIKQYQAFRSSQKQDSPAKPKKRNTQIILKQYVKHHTKSIVRDVFFCSSPANRNPSKDSVLEQQ